MNRIIYSFIASWNYGLVVLSESAHSLVFVGLSMGLILITLTHLLVLLESPTRARKVVVYGYKYWRDPEYIKECPEPEICEQLKFYGLSAKTSCYIIGYGFAAFVLLTSFLILPASL
jgi:hypothetical protein